MSTLLTINVKNEEPMTQSFYFMQKPATFSGGHTVYSNSLYSQSLANYSQSGSILTFQVNMQNYAGIQESQSAPSVGQSSGYASASRAIDLSSSSGSANDTTTASVNPLGLTTPTHGSGVSSNAFRVTTPPFVSPPFYNVGVASEVMGGIVLSSFVQASPSSNTDIAPVPKFYVQTGSYTPGAVLNFSQSSVTAALCDFSSGYTVIDVTLNPDGSWTVQNVS
jgi:hypothetical protein